MAKTSLQLLILNGPGEVEAMQLAVISKKWTLLVNTSREDAARLRPALSGVWQRRRVDAAALGFEDGDADGDSDGAAPLGGEDWRASLVLDERRPGRQSLLLESGSILLGITPGSTVADPSFGRDRVLVLDASWTHVSSFPEREEVRDAFQDAFEQGVRHVYYATNLAWDAGLFLQVAEETGNANRATVLPLSGFGQRMLWQVREKLPDVGDSDLVLLGLVPGRDDRGAFQRLRSDVAERTTHVRAYPVSPLSTGPGASREEALETVGLWLPTRVLIAGGPVSEQFLLSRYLDESTRGTPSSVGMVAGEYRLPSLNLSHQYDGGQRSAASDARRLMASRSGLVVLTYGRDETVQLAGAGLAEDARAVLPKIRIQRRGKTPEQLVRDVEGAFSSRGLPVPAVRYLP